MLYTEYLPLPTNSGTTVDPPFQNQISPNLKKLRLDRMFFTTTDGDITAAMQALFAQYPDGAPDEVNGRGSRLSGAGTGSS